MAATRLSPALPTVTQVSLPADARALSTLPRIDYEDAFTVGEAVDLTPRQWARAVIDDAPPRVRARLYMGWLGLGLKLGLPWSSHRVLGWRVARNEPDWLLLTANSWLGLRGELLFRARTARAPVRNASPADQSGRPCRVGQDHGHPPAGGSVPTDARGQARASR